MEKKSREVEKETKFLKDFGNSLGTDSERFLDVIGPNSEVKPEINLNPEKDFGDDGDFLK